MRHLHPRRQERAAPGEQSESGSFRRLVAALEEELQAQADAEYWGLAVCRSKQRGAPLVIDPPRGCEMTDARYDDSGRVLELTWRRWGKRGRPAHHESLSDGCQVAGAIVDHSDTRSSVFHSSPFVDGSVRPNCLSFEQATRRARAKALKTASTW
jgi:hypothetical protein